MEFAFVFMLLLMLAIGGFEYGMAFKDWLSVASATREGARVGSAAGDTAGADCRVLEATAGALQAITGNQVTQVWIYHSDPSGAIGVSDRYRPALPTDNPATLRCSTWFPLLLNWPEATRDNKGATRDWLGVRVVFDHSWTTNFLWWSGSVQWHEDTVMRLEPDVTN